MKIHYDTSVLVGKTIDQCYSLIEAFNYALIRSALVLLRREKEGLNSLARRTLLKAGVNPDNPDQLEELIKNNGLHISAQNSFIEKCYAFIMYDPNRINVSTTIDRTSNLIIVDKILSRG